MPIPGSPPTAPASPGPHGGLVGWRNPVSVYLQLLPCPTWKYPSHRAQPLWLKQYKSSLNPCHPERNLCRVYRDTNAVEGPPCRQKWQRRRKAFSPCPAQGCVSRPRPRGDANGESSESTESKIKDEKWNPRRFPRSDGAQSPLAWVWLGTSTGVPPERRRDW
jgi:hypothetical protein